MKISLIFKCLRCGQLQTEEWDAVEKYPIPTDSIHEFNLSIPVMINQVHSCTATQRGTMWFMGYDLIEDGHTGREPSLGDKNGRAANQKMDERD